MCMACEEEDLFLRYQLEMAIARGVIPPGFEAADFERMGLPVPGQAAAPAAGKPALAANPFACDTPDGE